MKLKIEDLSLEEKIGQMIIVGIDGSKITERTRKLILKYKIGGIILYKKNFKSYEEMVKLIKDLKTTQAKLKIRIYKQANRLKKSFPTMKSETITQFLNQKIDLKNLKNNIKKKDKE